MLLPEVIGPDGEVARRATAAVERQKEEGLKAKEAGLAGGGNANRPVAALSSLGGKDDAPDGGSSFADSHIPPSSRCPFAAYLIQIPPPELLPRF
jgi:hypothetical protein